MDRVLILLLVIGVTVLVSRWWRARDGRVSSTVAGLPREAVDVAAIVNSSTPYTLVEFTAPDCIPCVQTRLLLEELVADRPDVCIRTVDVADALDLLREHRIMRAPTTLFITEEGHLLGRVSGLPRRDELRSLLDSTRQPQPAQN